MKTRLSIACLLLFYLATPTQIAAQEQTSPANIFSRLQQYTPLNVVIETNMKQLRKDRKNEKWIPAVFRIMVGDSVAFEQAVKVATRGNMRKKTCDFPPVKIRFFEEKPEDDSLADINQLKLVSSCRYIAADEQLVQREFLAYELYNLLTDESFRVKAANIKFYNNGRNRPHKEGSVFFIESEKEMASRLGGRPLKPRIISPKVMDSLAYTRMCMFQFMIGNTDWGAYDRHNMKVVGLANSRIIPVPYDFDYAGLVDADYALPSPGMDLPNVRERRYLGLCHSSALYQQVIDEFLARKDEILTHCENNPELNLSSQADVRYYLNAFFSILENPEQLKKEILDSCDRRVISDD